MSNYTVIRSNDHLAHYGVLGMKWGRRKQRVLKGRRPGYGQMNKTYRQAIRSSYKANRKSGSSRRGSFYRASAEAQKTMINQYGKTSLDQLNTHNANMAKARAGIYLASMGIAAATMMMKGKTVTRYVR